MVKYIVVIQLCTFFSQKLLMLRHQPSLSKSSHTEQGMVAMPQSLAINVDLCTLPTCQVKCVLSTRARTGTSADDRLSIVAQSCFAAVRNGANISTTAARMSTPHVDLQWKKMNLQDML